MTEGTMELAGVHMTIRILRIQMVMGETLIPHQEVKNTRISTMGGTMQMAT